MSRAGRRRALLLLILVAAIWRVLPFLRIVQDPGAVSGALGEERYVRPFVGSDFDLTEFLVNPAITWAGSPVYLCLAALETQIGTGGGWLLAMQLLLSIGLVVVVFTIGEKMLGSAAALMAAFAFAVCEPAITMGWILAPISLLALASLWTARRCFDIARQCELSAGLPLGARLGLLALVQGYAALWFPAVMGWLPFCSRRFRRSEAWRFYALAATGFLVLLLPVFLHGVLVARDLVLPWENAAYDLRRAAESQRVFHVDDVEHVDYPLARRQIAVAQSEGRGSGANAKAPARWSQDLGVAWTAYLARPELPLQRVAVASGGFASWPEGEGTSAAHLLRGLPTIPVAALLPFTLLGAIALASSVLSYAPLYMGLLIPLLVMALTGVDAATQSVMLPFQALFAGYGAARAWASRKWPASWFIVPVVLGFGTWWVLNF